jgi:hypothetical protein
MLASGIFEQLGRFGIEKRQERRSEGPVRVSPGQFALIRVQNTSRRFHGICFLRSSARTTTSHFITLLFLQTKQANIRCSIIDRIFSASCVSLDVSAQDSYLNVEKALALYPQHTESLELLQALKKKLAR